MMLSGFIVVFSIFFLFSPAKIIIFRIFASRACQSMVYFVSLQCQTNKKGYGNCIGNGFMDACRLNRTDLIWRQRLFFNSVKMNFLVVRFDSIP